MSQSNPTSTAWNTTGLKLLFWLFLTLFLAGCQPVVRDVQPNNIQEYLLKNGGSFGQSFVAVYDGLEEVQIYLSPIEAGRGTIVLQLTEGALSGEALRTSQLNLEAVSSPGYYSFNFPALPDSQGRYYYAWLELEGEGGIMVHTAPGAVYTQGAFYIDHNPVDVQANFRLGYQPSGLLAGLVRMIMSWAGMLAAGVLLFVLPGWALLHIARPAGLDWVERTALAAGISLALIPILILWTGLAGLHLGAWYAWLLVFIGVGTTAVLAVRKLLLRNTRRDSKEPGLSDPTENAQTTRGLAQAVLVGVLVLIILTRFWPVRNLEGPMWGDSVQHTVMTQLFLDNKGLFENWLPYAPYESLTVQFGFSAAAALFSWLTGLSSLQATLWTGQLLNILAVLALYPLAVRVAGGRQWAGVGAVVVGGLLSPTPAVYVNWGRYAQLAGQTIFPAAVWLLWEALEKSSLPGSPDAFGSVKRGISATFQTFLQLPWKIILPAGLVLAGMTLTYYRMPFFYAAFGAALLVGWAVPTWKLDLSRWAAGLTTAFLGGVAAFTLLLPWGLMVMGGQLAEVVEAGVVGGSLLENVLGDYRNWLFLFDYLPAWMVGLAFAALVVSLVKKQWLPASLALWATIMASLVALSLLRVPGTNMIQNFAVIIAMYLPAALLVGWLVGWITSSAWLSRPTIQLGVGIFILLAGGWGALNQRSIVQPSQYAMITRPDMLAMAWVNENLPEGSRFLVEGFSIYGGFTAVGSDAGWWLPLVAGRENTMPPQYALMNERPIVSGYSQRVVELVVNLEEHRPGSQDGRKQLCDLGITHIYIGQGQGQVSLNRFQLFAPEDFLSSPYFELVYRQDRVYIFAHSLESCEQNGS